VDDIAEAELNTEVVQSPMVGITVRLPAERLEKVREIAARQGVKTTALIRRWVDNAVDAEDQPVGRSFGLGFPLRTENLESQVGAEERFTMVVSSQQANIGVDVQMFESSYRVSA
jgi:hypothetical protein